MESPTRASDVSWWETGLLKESWKAQWIGYEDPEHRAVRKSGAMWITNTGSASPNLLPTLRTTPPRGAPTRSTIFAFDSSSMGR